MPCIHSTFNMYKLNTLKTEECAHRIIIIIALLSVRPQTIAGLHVHVPSITTCDDPSIMLLLRLSNGRPVPTCVRIESKIKFKRCYNRSNITRILHWCIISRASCGTGTILYFAHFWQHKTDLAWGHVIRSTWQNDGPGPHYFISWTHATSCWTSGPTNSIKFAFTFCCPR